MTAHPFRLAPEQLSSQLDEAVAATFADLTSQFMFMPKGDAFLTYEHFNAGYEAVRIESGNFTHVGVERLWTALRKNARSLLALRAIIGVTPPEWVDLAKEEVHGFVMTHDAARTIERSVKRDPNFFTTRGGSTPLTVERVTAMLRAAEIVLARGPGDTEEHLINRLDKIDTRSGLSTIHHAAMHDIPYSVLLYERYLGRPYASHRDAISELVGDVMESAIEARLHEAGIRARKTKRAERLPSFEQAPDFFVPDELDPAVIIEAKITGDDGTARDKVARVLRLAHMRDERRQDGRSAFEVVACVDGRGFGVRKQDMRDLIQACEGKVFTLATLDDLIDCTRLKEFRPR